VENCLDRDQARRPAVVLQPRAGDRDTAAAAVGALGVAEIDGVIGCEIAAEDHVHQAGLALRVNLQHAGKRRRQLAGARDDAQAAGPFGHQHAAVGQEGERPGMHQAAGDCFDRKLAGGGGENLRRRPGGAHRQQQGQQQNESHARLHRPRVNFAGSRRVPTVRIGLPALSALFGFSFVSVPVRRNGHAHRKERYGASCRNSGARLQGHGRRAPDDFEILQQSGQVDIRGDAERGYDKERPIARFGG
jgi:hypothetical protein